MSHLTLTLAEMKTKTLTLTSNVTRDDLQRRFLAQHSVAELEQCCNHSKQCCNAVLR